MRKMESSTVLKQCAAVRLPLRRVRLPRLQLCQVVLQDQSCGGQPRRAALRETVESEKWYTAEEHFVRSKHAWCGRVRNNNARRG